MFNTYAIINKNGKIYIGYTSDLNSRLKRHNNLLKNKKTSYTAKNRNGEWKLIYKEDYKTRSEAQKREKQLKSYQGRQFIKKQ